MCGIPFTKVTVFRTIQCRQSFPTSAALCCVIAGTHFGFWYRMHATPDGPSRSTHPNYCPRKVPMGEFANNTVHSQGWFGIWIFQVHTALSDRCLLGLREAAVVAVLSVTGVHAG